MKIYRIGNKDIQQIKEVAKNKGYFNFSIDEEEKVGANIYINDNYMSYHIFEGKSSLGDYITRLGKIEIKKAFCNLVNEDQHYEIKNIEKYTKKQEKKILNTKLIEANRKISLSKKLIEVGVDSDFIPEIVENLEKVNEIESYYYIEVVSNYKDFNPKRYDHYQGNDTMSVEYTALFGNIEFGEEIEKEVYENGMLYTDEHLYCDSIYDIQDTIVVLENSYKNVELYGTKIICYIPNTEHNEDEINKINKALEILGF